MDPMKPRETDPVFAELIREGPSEEDLELVVGNISGEPEQGVAFVSRTASSQEAGEKDKLRVKRYKNIDLLIVGEFWEDKKEYLDEINKLNIKNHVKIIDEYVANENVGNYFLASDIVVLPYISTTNSGIVQTAFGFNKPVIATNVGGLPEVVINKKTGLVIKPESSGEIFKAVSYFYDKIDKNEIKKNIIKDKKRFSWDKLVKVVEDLTIH